MADEIRKKFIIEGDVDSVNNALNELDNNLDSNSAKITEVTQKTEKLNKVQRISTEEVTKNGGAISILDAATGGMATQFKNAYEATRLFNGSLVGMRKALIATGIGALVVALGLIVAYWEDIRDFISGANRELDEQIKRTQELANTSKYNNDLLSSSENTMKRRGITQKEINNLKIKENEITLSLLLTEISLEAQRLDALQRLRTEGGSTLQQFLRGYATLFEGIYKFIDDMFAKIGIQTNIAKKHMGSVDWVMDGIFGTEEDIQNSKDRMDDLLLEATKLQNQIDGLKNSNDDIDKAAADKLIAEKEKELEETNKLILEGYEQREKEKQEFEDRLREIEEENREIRLRKLLGDEAYEISENQKKYEALLMQAEEFGYDELELLEAREREKLEIEKRYQDERDAIKKEREEREAQEKADKFILDMENEELTFNERRELINQRREEINNDEKLSAEEKLEFLKDVSAAVIKLEEEETDAKMMAANITSSLLSSMSSLLGEHTAEGKAMAIAATTIDTIQGSISVFNGMADAIKGPVGIALGVAAAAATVARGMAAVKKIVAVKVPGGKGGGGTPATPAMAAPQFNVVGRSSTNQLADVMRDQNNNDEPIRAYVVSSEVTTGQNLDRNRIDNSTFL